MKVIFWIFIAIVLLFYIGHLNISLSPFKISMPYWYRSVGVALWVTGLIVYNVGEQTTGYSKGLKNGSEMVFEAIDNLSKEKNIQKEQK